MIIDVLRPTAIVKSGGGTATPSGTLNGVTSDNNDTTYIQFPVASFGNNWSLTVTQHLPTAGYERHQIRGRIRIRTNAGTCIENIDLGKDANTSITYDGVDVTAAMTEVYTGWAQNAGFNLGQLSTLTGLNIGGGWMSNAAGGATETRTAECYVDVDTRAQPDFDPQVRDAAGNNKSAGTVTDTNQPTVYIGAVNYDSLPARDWSITVFGVDGEVFSSSGSGIAPTSVLVTSGLDDGDYTASYSVRSTIRGTDPFEATALIGFSVANSVPPPSPPLLTVVPDSGGYLVTWADPGGQEWDTDYAIVAELWREDCNGSQRIATVPDGLNGSYLDLAIPQLDPQPSGVDCEESSIACDITYSVRYWGYVSTTVTLPSTIPDDLILGWPGTIASIPSGWTRVSSLDSIYPRGATGTGAPVASGGGPSHLHTTSSHAHTLSAHNHTVGGSTGTSNVSTTSARFNGASQPQADQPHSHTRPSYTGTVAAVASGASAPGTEVDLHIPATLEVIWIQSGGAQASYPIGAVGWATESVAGWDASTDGSGRFLRGAAVGTNGGATNGAATHTHQVSSHSHTGSTHDHSIGATSLSNPASSQEAGTGSSTPRWLPRHTHPMDVGSNSTGLVPAVFGGTTGATNHEPLHRRLRVLQNASGGIQTRIIGLYLGTVAALDPTLTLCNGSNGTPDMRGYFARDAAADGVNSTGGTATHTHTVPNHTHTMASHAHTTNVLTSTTGSFEAPTSGDLGNSPTTGHDHTSANTGSTASGVTSNGAGTSGSGTNVPPYKEAHFVRLDGTIAGGSLPVPALKVTEFAVTTVPALTHTDDMDRLASLDTVLTVVSDRSSSFPKLVTDSVPITGGLHTVSSTPAGEDLTLIIAVYGLAAIDDLEALLASDVLYWSPLGGTSGWFAPGGWSVTAPAPNVKVVQITMVRQAWPATDEPAVFL